MAKAPKRCPMCKEKEGWIKVDTTRKGFSVSKAAVGIILPLGSAGVLAGAIGNKYESYCCKNCRFTHEYKK